MRFCHSYWTKPALDDPRADRGAECPDITQRLNREPWLFALSMHYVQRRGHTIVLHTDRHGEQLFGFLPYDEVHCDLDDLSVAADLFFSAGKVRALKIEPVGAVHVDGDAFLKAPQVFETIASGSYDAIAQSVDFVWPNTLDFLDMLRPYLRRRASWLFDNVYAYNTGVYGFQSEELRDEFIAEYEWLTQYLSRSPGLLVRARARARELAPGRYCLGIDPLLFGFIKARRYKARVLWAGEQSAAIRPGHPFSDAYEHHAFHYKYRNDEFAVLKRRLEEENPALYRLVREREHEGFAGRQV